jgi:hypothetical protein
MHNIFIRPLNNVILILYTTISLSSHYTNITLSIQPLDRLLLKNKFNNKLAMPLQHNMIVMGW